MSFYITLSLVCHSKDGSWRLPQTADCIKHACTCIPGNLAWAYCRFKRQMNYR